MIRRAPREVYRVYDEDEFLDADAGLAGEDPVDAGPSIDAEGEASPPDRRRSWRRLAAAAPLALGALAVLLLLAGGAPRGPSGAPQLGHRRAGPAPPGETTAAGASSDGHATRALSVRHARGAVRRLRHSHGTARRRRWARRPASAAVTSNPSRASPARRAPTPPRAPVPPPAPIPSGAPAAQQTPAAPGASAAHSLDPAAEDPAILEFGFER